MNNLISLRVYLTAFLVNLPTLIVCMGACLVILGRWKSNCSWSVWALSGFGLGIFIAILAPISQALMQSWVMQSGNVSGHIWIFSLLGIAWNVLHAVAYALLFVAIFAGRE